MTTQLLIFDQPVHCGGPALPHNGTPTSAAAAEAMCLPAIPQREVVFAFIRARGEYGATIEEISLGTPFKESSVCGRCAELKTAGRIYETTTKRLTTGKCEAVVLRAAP